MDKGHWEYPTDFNTDDWFGFIYRIIDTASGKEYIGKKQFHRHISKPPKAGKIRRRREIKESDWRKYTSSSTHVNAEILDKGQDKFIFLIESLHSSKSSLHYAEVQMQVEEDVLRARFPNGDRKYYNAQISATKFIPKEETSEEAKHRIAKAVKIKWRNELFQQHMNPEWDKKYRIGAGNYDVTSLKTAGSDIYQDWLENNRLCEKVELDD